MTDKSPAPIVAAEGWHVLHLFYKVEHGAWSLLSQAEQFTARTRLSDLIAEIHSTEGAQVLTFAMVSPKADLGFMLLCADLHTANAFEKRLTAALGPDVLAPEFDAPRFLRRLREDDPTRPIGDALLDQRTVAGLGTIWRTEGCFAAALDPWRATSTVSDDEALAVIEAVRPRMTRSASEGFNPRETRIYGKVGQPCPRCGAAIRSRGQGDNNRRTYWCAGCQT